MKLSLIVLGALLACACAGDAEKSGKEAAGVTEKAIEKEKRQTQEAVAAAPAHYVYRVPRRQHQYEQVAAVHEPQEEEDADASARIPVKQDYRPGQVFSLNTRELFELQPERKSSYVDQQQLQQIYQDVQAHQVALQPSHTVIARPPSSVIGAEAHVGAALSVSDAGADATALDFDRELLALIGHTPQTVRTSAPQPPQEPAYQQTYTRYQEQKITEPSYPQPDTRYTPKPLSKAKSKPRTKAYSTQPPPQQYLIETTNPQQVRPVESPRPAQSLRYVTVQPTYYERPEPQALSVVAAPKFQQARAQQAYRFIQAQPQPEGSVQKQYRLIQEVPKPPAPEPKVQQQQVRYIYSPSVDRPVTYLKRYQPKQAEEVAYVSQQQQARYQIPQQQERYQSPPQQVRYQSQQQQERYQSSQPQERYQSPQQQESYQSAQQQAQFIGEQLYIRPVYRPADQQRNRYELTHLALGSTDATRTLESQPRPAQAHSVAAAHSAIYVSKNTLPKKAPATPRPLSVNVVQHGETLEDQRARLPPPRNNKAYTPEEFAALVAAGYSVTPVPVHEVTAQSRSAPEPQAVAPAPVRARRPHYAQRAPQYLPFRGDDAP